MENNMKEQLDPRTKGNARLIRSLASALILICVLGGAAEAKAQQVTPPPTSTKITPPAGNTAFLLGHGVGTQGYVCLPTGAGATTASWTINNARPEATLFETVFGQEFQIITHFLSPNTNPNQFAPDPLPFGNATWQSSLDSSKVWAQTVNSVAAGSESSCPNTGAIGCLLLQAIGSQPGPSGGKVMTRTTFIQRLNTKGGSAPGDGCSVLTDVGKQSLVPYSADYFFYTTTAR
jgi:hypothetical protein